MQMFWEAIKPLCQRHLQSIETGAEKKANIQAAVVGKTPAAEQPIAEGSQAVDDDGSTYISPVFFNQLLQHPKVRAEARIKVVSHPAMGSLTLDSQVLVLVPAR